MYSRLCHRFDVPLHHRAVFTPRVRLGVVLGKSDTSRAQLVTTRKLYTLAVLFRIPIARHGSGHLPLEASVLFYSLLF